TFTSTESDRQYAQKFNKAYFRQTERGEYDAVLIEDGISTARRSTAGPIQASATAPLNQVVHIRVLWRPLRGSKPDTPSATNAVIDWYVRANDPGGRGDHLHYRGAGFVTIDGSGSEARFAIRSAHLELADGAGSLRDPLGDSSLSGTFIAARRPELVSST